MWVNLYSPIVNLLLGGLLCIISSCNSRIIQKSSVGPKLYIYHNGIDTIIKNYQIYQDLKPMLDSMGINQNYDWVPDTGSSLFEYFQFNGLDSITKTISLTFDSNIIYLNQSGRKVSNETFELIQQSDNSYYFREKMANASYFISYHLTIEGDSLHIDKYNGLFSLSEKFSAIRYK